MVRDTKTQEWQEFLKRAKDLKSDPNTTQEDIDNFIISAELESTLKEVGFTEEQINETQNEEWVKSTKEYFKEMLKLSKK